MNERMRACFAIPDICSALALLVGVGDGSANFIILRRCVNQKSQEPIHAFCLHNPTERKSDKKKTIKSSPFSTFQPSLTPIPLASKETLRPNASSRQKPPFTAERPPPPLAPSRRNKPPHPPTRTNIPGKNLRSLSAGWKTWEVCGSRRTRGRSCPRRVFLVLSLLCFLMQLVDGGWVLDCAVRAPAARESAHVSRWMAEGEAGWWRCCWGAWVVGRGVFLVCCCC